MKCICCGQETNILICIDPFTNQQRLQLGEQKATYCCKDCGSMIIRELIKQRCETRDTSKPTADCIGETASQSFYVDCWGRAVEPDSIKFLAVDAYGVNHTFQIIFHDLGAKRSYRAEEIYRVTKTAPLQTESQLLSVSLQFWVMWITISSWSKN